MPTVQLLLGDCLERMSEIPDGSIDLICADPPYGTTSCRWDSVIPFEPLWAHYRRVTKPNAAIVLFCGEPFTSALVMSNIAGFSYRWTWKKIRPTGFLNAKRRPLKLVEDICVFGGSRYFPQGLIAVDREMRNSTSKKSTGGHVGLVLNDAYRQEFTNYPRDVLEYGLDEAEKHHPTQKPVALLEYLIRTYTNEGETVLDNTMGSGSTGVACVNTGRAFIGIERDETYFATAQRRIAEAQSQPMLLAAE